MPSSQPPIPPSTPPDPARAVGAGAPDPAKCRAERNRYGPNLARCLVRPIPQCAFGFYFAGGYFCRHPEVDRIIARTRGSA